MEILNYCYMSEKNEDYKDPEMLELAGITVGLSGCFVAAIVLFIFARLTIFKCISMMNGQAHVAGLFVACFIMASWFLAWFFLGTAVESVCRYMGHKSRKKDIISIVSGVVIFCFFIPHLEIFGIMTPIWIGIMQGIYVRGSMMVSGYIIDQIKKISDVSK